MQSVNDILAKLLPQGVQIGDEVDRGEGIVIGGAHLDNAIISYVKQGDFVPLKDMSFVIGIQGRGTLNIPGSEFLALLSVGIALTKRIAGLDQPVDGEFTEAADATGATVAEQTA